MTANKPLRRPDDYFGLKMRIQSSKVIAAQMQALGAVPQVLAFSEVYPALQTGVIDGCETTVSNIYTQKLHELQKYVTVTRHGYNGYAVIVNAKFWDGSPVTPADVINAFNKQWDGYADAMLHPYDQDPPQGWIGTANQRTAPRGYGMQLSNSWDAPERSERLATGKIPCKR